MKQINAVTDFGIKPVKTIGGKRQIMGEFWIVAEVPCRYMNNDDEPMFLRRVIHYETGCNLPIRSMPCKAPAKDYLFEAECFLKNIPLKTVKIEISKYEIINPKLQDNGKQSSTYSL